MTIGTAVIVLMIWIAACTSKPETKDDHFGLLDGRDRTGK